MDIVGSVVPQIVNKLVNAAILQARYPLHFNRYVKELETEREKLQSKIEGVLDCTKEAKKKTEKVVSDVDKWLKEADSLVAKVVELQEKAKKRNMTSCLKYCPNFIMRYSLAKKLEEKTNEIIKHTQLAIEFPKFSRLATLVNMTNYLSSKGFVHFDSRKVAYNELLEALKDDNVHMIGLYGMGGCGKTTLAIEVGKEAEQFFQKVVFVAVSNTFDVRKIQGKIASQLDWKLEEEEEPDRARRLFMRLTSGERFLIILDDIWRELDFKAIGIPIAENQKGCTTLITTRKFDVCRSMNCKRTISLKGLNEDEAWFLFQKHSGTFDDNSNTLKDLAQKITKECGGLPVAIAAVASTLKGKTQVEYWDEALETLRDSSWVDIEGSLKDIYACLRLSYDNLENEVAKSLFLLCSIYPEDFEIPIDQLTIIGMGLGLVGEVHSYKKARNQVIIAKNKLIDCCLLLEVNEEISVKMHDLVRDVALWIAKKHIKLIMRQERSQKVVQEDMIMKDDTIKYLWIDKVDKFPYKLECPELEFLYICIGSKHPMDVTNEFFKGMKKLRVLFLQNEDESMRRLIQWPKSVHLLNNLRCLFLIGCKFGYISFIGSLERLESLRLWNCSFDELPECIIEQKNLKLLDLWECEIQRNPYEVIGRCSQLEVLYFCQNKVRDWENQGKNGAEFFGKISATLALESYCIDLGENGGDFYRQKFPITRSLFVEDFETSTSNAIIKDLMQRAEVLSLKGIHKSCTNIIPDIFQRIGGRMHALTQLSLLYSDEIECVMNVANHLGQVGIISKLTHLTIKGMKHLKTVCHGQPPHGLFAKLEVLEIYGCDSLEHIIADEAKEIVVDDGEYQRSYKFAFPKLKIIIIYQCSQLEYLMPVSFAQSLTQLEVLNIQEADKLKGVFGQSLYEDPNPNKFQIIEFSALRKLHLICLPNIISICPENYRPTWPSLERLKLRECPQLNTMSINPWIASSRLRQGDDKIALKDLLKAVVTPLETLQYLFVDDNNNIEVIFHLEGLPNNGQPMNSSLQYLVMCNLPELRHIWTGPKNFLHAQNLHWLSIDECGNLKVIFPTCILRSLPQLKRLRIRNCKELEEIIGDDEENQNLLNPDQILFPNLMEIFIKCCHKLKCVFSVSTCRVLPKLRIMSIEEASQLEQVFGHEQQGKIHRKEVVTSDLECVILRQLPRLTLDLQTVRYLVVLESPRLDLTSNITSQELLQILKSKKVDDIAYAHARWDLCFVLENISKSNEDRSKQINGKESGVELASESKHFSSHAQNNEQKLTPITSHLTKNVRKSKDQSAQETNISEEKGVKGSVEEGSTSKNAIIITSSTPSEAASSLLDSLVTSLPKALPHTQINVNQTEFGKNTRANPVINLQGFEDDGGELLIPCVSIVDTNKDELTKSVKEQEDQSAQERNISKEKIKAVLSTHSRPASSLLDSLVTSLPEVFPHRQIIVNQTKIEIDTEANPINQGQLSILSVPFVDTTKDELVAKAFVDLEVSLKMPLKDIATSETNSLRLLTALNFLCRLSFEDGALSHGLKAIIESLLQDLPSIIYSFKPAFATINKFPKFMDEAQEKEERLKEQISMLEKEMQDCEAKLSCLQAKKKKCATETIEVKREIDNVRKEKSEMVEDKRKAQQQLFQADYKWSVLCSQFQLNSIAARNLC